MGLLSKLPSNFLTTSGAVLKDGKYITAVFLSFSSLGTTGKRGCSLSAHGGTEREAIRCFCRHRVNAAHFSPSPVPSGKAVFL